MTTESCDQKTRYLKFKIIEKFYKNLFYNPKESRQYNNIKGI